jgi:hypothetical protein
MQLFLFYLFDQYSSRITNVITYNSRLVDEDGDNCGPAQLCINIRIKQLLISPKETFAHNLLHFL